ncbi:MAG: ribulose bisphosphate carboxylase small subunit, partial [Actinomycetota bacterium]|nr:ribulose bisphosphate carboxylase small subunit [Actinomycetota bacterium]
MRIKQGTFSTLPDPTDEDRIKAQIQYCIDQ